MGGDCGPYVVEEKCTRGFGGETWKEEASWKT